MSRLTSVHGSFPAHVLAARLEAEGIPVQLRGNVDGPYAVTVGDLALVELYVSNEQFDTASELLLEGAVEDALDESPRISRRLSWPVKAVIWVLLLLPVWSLVRFVAENT